MRQVLTTLTFEQQVQNLTMHVIADALPRHRAVLFVGELLIDGIVEENNRQAFGSRVIDPTGTERKEWDTLGLVELAMKCLRVGVVRGPQGMIELILNSCFVEARNVDFLDTDEIPTLVGVAYGTGVTIRREVPETARRWVEGGTFE